MARLKRQFFPTGAETSGILTHLHYEIHQMIYSISCHDSLVVSAREDAHALMQRNAFLESSLLHARALLDFFESSERKQRGGSELDDVLSWDFGFSAAPILIPSDLRDRLNKDLAHITYSRLQRIDNARDWRMGEIMFPLIERSLAFAEHLAGSPTLLGAKDVVDAWRATASDLRAILKVVR
jgi:hypothetical protein